MRLGDVPGSVLFILGLTVSSLTVSCGLQSTHRESLSAQALADSQAKFDELAPAEGFFLGKMRLLRSGQEFDVSVRLQRVMENVRAPGSPDATDTAAVPKLSGNMRFPAIERIGTADFPMFSELLNPMGGFATSLFDFGDFNPKNRTVLLPYTVPSYNQGNYGELSGQLDGDHFHGTWFSKPFGNVGEFDLLRGQGNSGPLPGVRHG